MSRSTYEISFFYEFGTVQNTIYVLILTNDLNKCIYHSFQFIISDNFVTEFLYQRFFVFKDSIDTNEEAKKKSKEQILEKQEK